MEAVWVAVAVDVRVAVLLGVKVGVVTISRLTVRVAVAEGTWVLLGVLEGMAVAVAVSVGEAACVAEAAAVGDPTACCKITGVCVSFLRVGEACAVRVRVGVLAFGTVGAGKAGTPILISAAINPIAPATNRKLTRKIQRALRT